MQTDYLQLRDWEFPVDNRFAEHFRAQVDSTTLPHPADSSARLCERCADLDFESESFTLEVNRSTLSLSGRNCDFCAMLESACERDTRFSKGDSVQIERVESNLKLAHADFPILSLLRNIGT